MEAFTLTGGKAFVVGFLTNAFELFKGQRLNFFERYFLDFFLNHLRLGFRLRLRLRIKAGQRPAIEGLDVIGANQLTQVLVG
ncbi:hypothetical protein D3C79_1049500 [compost metagenome]